MNNYYIRPPIVTLEDISFLKEYKTYSEYNYLKPGIISYVKTRHFELALKLTKKYFHNCNVIDFGCADGVFLPSLAKYFNHVVAIDYYPAFIRTADKLVHEMKIDNVDLICNKGLTFNDVKLKISDKEYHILYLLEVLEHIGEKSNMYQSKVQFLREVSNLIKDDGIIVYSVPKMIGLSFLIQRIGLALFRVDREPISISDLIKAGIFNDTSNLEMKWNQTHLGFNHKKLEETLLISSFRILEKHDDFFQVVYVIGK